MRVFLRRLAYVAIAVLFVLIAAVFAYGNQEPIALDIGIIRFEGVSLTVVLAVTFAIGALFGGLLAGVTMLRHFSERRALKRELKRARAELDSLRSLPLPDAD
jgi:uncharacterized integral membrane protein